MCINNKKGSDVYLISLATKSLSFYLCKHNTFRTATKISNWRIKISQLVKIPLSWSRYCTICVNTFQVAIDWCIHYGWRCPQYIFWYDNNWSWLWSHQWNVQVCLNDELHASWTQYFSTSTGVISNSPAISNIQLSGITHIKVAIQ